jgi:RNA polymerase sigma-70 factor (ECF subfamily)
MDERSHAGSGLPPASSSGLPDVPDLADTLVLVRRARAGDRAALDRIFARYQDRVHRIVRIRMGAKLRGSLDSSDIVQETCAVALQKLAGFEPRDHSSLIQWLARIAERQIHDAADRMNAEKRDKRREVALEPLARAAHESDADLALADPGPGPCAAAAANELEHIYDACVQSLPDEQRELILLREYANASWATICRELGRPNEHAAQEAYRRAQIKLSSLLRQRVRR